MTERLMLPAQVRAAVNDHAMQGTPEEVCGILLGPDPSQVAAVWRADNVDEEPVRHYTIAPQAIVDALAWATERDLDIVGFYHSHPRGPPHPSTTDEARATWVGAIYMIRSLDPDMLGAWRWNGEGFDEVQVVGTPAAQGHP